MPLPLPVTCRRAVRAKTIQISSHRGLLQDAMEPVVLDGPTKEKTVGFLPAPTLGAAPKSEGDWEGFCRSARGGLGFASGASPHQGQEGSWPGRERAAPAAGLQGPRHRRTSHFPAHLSAPGCGDWRTAQETDPEPRVRAPASFCCLGQKGVWGPQHRPKEGTGPA